MSLTIREKLLIHSVFFTIITVMLFILAVSFLNYHQTKTQNLDRMSHAIASVERHILSPAADIEEEYKKFADAPETGEILLDTIEVLSDFLTTHQRYEFYKYFYKYGSSSGLSSYGFYLSQDNDKKSTLMFQFNHDLSGMIIFKKKLMKMEKFGFLKISDIEPLNIFPENYHMPGKYALNNIDNKLSLIFNYPVKYKDEIEPGSPRNAAGYFVLQKALDIDLEILSRDLGVNINLYNYSGVMIQGKKSFPNLNPLNIKKSNEMNILTDNKGENYDAVIKPLKYKETSAGYISVSISRTITSKRIRQAVFVLSAIGLFIIILILIESLFFVHFITMPIRRLTDFVKKVKAGDSVITLEKQSRDDIGELGTALNNLIISERKSIEQMKEFGLRIDSSINRISEAVTDQVSVMHEQSALISEISSAVEELSKTSALIAENSDSVALMADNALNKAKKGAESVTMVMKRTDHIKRKIQENILKVNILGEKYGEIFNAVKIIHNIAYQTKLIAFNASLESAGAGESGKRFGVVAGEIRRLADNVTESVSRIENMINEIQDASESMINASEDSAKEVHKGISSFSMTGELLYNILDDADSVTDAAKQISLSTQQQKTASEQVTLSLREILQGAEQNYSAINNISSICDNLKELSKDLQEFMTV